MTALTADGCVQELVAISADECCPIPLECIDKCALACSFINLLPSGPLWDRAKQEAFDYYNSNTGKDPCSFTCPPPELTCQSLVAYAIFQAFSLADVIGTALWPAIRESNPATAVTTLDDWLVRYAWQDCFASVCRSGLLGTLTPYEIADECGNILFCPVDTPDDLKCAVKRGIILALGRAAMGGVQNLCWLNWVIEPLGAKLVPQNVDANICNQCAPPCEPPLFSIVCTSDYLDGCPKPDLCGDRSGGKVLAVIKFNTCNQVAGMPPEIRPGVIAAECIIRSLIPVTCPSNIIRGCC